MKAFTHLDESGEARMVDITAKAESARTATAEACVRLSEDAFAAVVEGRAPKGDVAATARIAGIMAAKKTYELVPLCHPIPITGVKVDLTPEPETRVIRITALVQTKGQTGVEMEALTAVSVAALTLYDMVKAIDKSISIEGTRLLHKEGGKSGTYRAPGSAKASSGTTANGAQQRLLAHRNQPVRRKPSEIMSSTAAPRPLATDDRRRECFRRFILDNHIRVTQWAVDAGIPVGQVYGYLHGRMRRLSDEAEAALARAAHASVAAVFGD